ncbi:MAG: C4-type zinc ribbon domain-containing protein [Thermodesulfobacteriota bacterium]|nr:C4-type zinc ribbon domain-containing protein [Thermodesulfobacteriota bacterium]
MNNQLDLLVELQNLDVELLKIERERVNSPKEIEELENNLEKEKVHFEENKIHFSSMEEKKRKVEREIAYENERIEKSQERLNQVKTNKEYQAILKEIEGAKERVLEWEEELLELLVGIEEEKKTVSLIEDALKDKIKYTEERKLEHKNRIAKIQAGINAIEDNKKIIQAKVDPQSLARYEFIKSKKNGIAVAPLDKGICLGCNMNVPPQVCNEVIRNCTIVICPNCNRILYLKKNEHS